jgi:trk system potassium uptake protein TrkH
MKSFLYKLMNIRPGLLILLGYLTVISAGALILMLPFCQIEKVSFLDIFFTCTSAVCVTGLVTVNTATAWTFWGQLAILVLIQLGGLGIMTIATAIFSSAGRRLSTGERLYFQETVATGKFRDFLYLVKRIYILTFIFELIGAIIMFFGFRSTNSLPDAIWHSLFQSISSFNNAGFSTFPGNLIDYGSNLLVVVPIMSLIIFGGLGYFVMIEVLEYRPFRPHNRFSAHTKSVLIMTALLILAGMVGMHLSGGSNWLDSLFQSVTARTAGYNTVDIAALPHPAIIVLVILMFIGASPGSTGGGIKTTSFLLVFRLALSRLFGKSRVSLYRKTIPQTDVARAVAVFILAIMVVVACAAGIIIFQGGQIYDPDNIFELAIFETVSALGTVGLSMGLTPYLSSMGKVIIILTMLIGKVGILTFAHSLAASKGKKEIIYAEESIMIG